MCVLIYLQYLPATVFILRRIPRDVVVNVHGTLCKLPLFFACFNEFFPTDLIKIFKYKISLKPVE
jgi:hypothetical protein